MLRRLRECACINSNNILTYYWFCTNAGIRWNADIRWKVREDKQRKSILLWKVYNLVEYNSILEYTAEKGKVFKIRFTFLLSTGRLKRD